MSESPKVRNFPVTKWFLGPAPLIALKAGSIGRLCVCCYILYVYIYIYILMWLINSIQIYNLKLYNMYIYIHTIYEFLGSDTQWIHHFRSDFCHQGSTIHVQNMAIKSYKFKQTSSTSQPPLLNGLHNLYEQKLTVEDSRQCLSELMSLTYMFIHCCGSLANTYRLHCQFLSGAHASQTGTSQTPLVSATSIW